MRGWYAEARREGVDGNVEAWQRIGGPYNTQERAKAECAKELKWASNKRLWFRTVADDDRGTVYQMSVPPHAWRLRWVNAVW
jgi:hypothetical protein